MSRLIHSAKFWTLVLDVVISNILYFTGKYAGASVFADIKFLIAALQPVFLFLIGTIAWEDSAANSAGNVAHR
jgi:hypothetical protein